jgi:hypothetical protein
VKACLLSQGLVPTPAFLAAFGPPFLEKRRAYGNPDDAQFSGETLPQELYILPDHLICAVNVRASSPWRLDCQSAAYRVYHAEMPDQRVDVTFPLRPSFYDSTISDRTPVRKIVTLYGGGSLGVFVYGRCSLNDMGKACHFCSLGPNRKNQTEFPEVLQEDQVREAIQRALQDTATPISQVMINGGNFADMDKGFCYYAEIVAAAREAIQAVARNVELHLIVGPPRDLRLIERLRGSDVRVAMNLEVGDSEVFSRVCPGKHELYGQEYIRQALLAVLRHLGPGSANSIFVGGLEPIETLAAGMTRAAADGIVPVVNVFHPDPETLLAGAESPSPAHVVDMGKALQDIYMANPWMRPFYLDCGRNSLDTEAHRRLF